MSQIVPLHFSDSRDGVEEDTLEQGLRRRPSIDSRTASKLLNAGSAEVAPFWFRRYLAYSGGSSGNEHRGTKAAIAFLGTIHCFIPPLMMWSIGLPAVPDTVCLIVAFLILVIPGFYVRWQFLKSGIIWSLTDSDLHKKTLAKYDAECRSFVLLIPVEGVVLNIIAVTFGIMIDVAGRYENFGMTRYVFGAGLGIVNVICHTVVHYTFKGLPMFLRIVCDLLIEDMKRFHQAVDAALIAAPSGPWSPSDCMGKGALLDVLQSQECSLRVRLSAARMAMEPLIVYATGSASILLAVSVFCLVRNIENVVIAPLFIFVVLISMVLMISAVHGAARVGDCWLQLLDDLNTPATCARTAVALGGVPLADRLGQLRYMGVTVLGHTVTSSTVTSVIFTLASGLALAILGFVYS